MVDKLPKTNAVPPEAAVPLADVVQDSAQQIWQAGLGAFNKAQAESNKAFEALVKEGVNLQRKTQSAAEESLSEAADKMSNMANNLSFKATGQWDKLESIFEDRVAKALQRLGVPCAKDIELLIARVEELTQTVQQLSIQQRAAPPAPKPLTKVKPARRSPTRQATTLDGKVTPD